MTPQDNAAPTLEELRKAADDCHESCFDYSCVRRGDCGGHAGHAYRDEAFRLKEQREQDESDRKLAEQINRLKKSGAIVDQTERLARLEAALRDAEPVLQAMWSGKYQDVTHSQVAKARLSCAAALSPLRLESSHERQ